MLINTYDLSFWFFQVDTFCPDKSFAQLDIFSVKNNGNIEEKKKKLIIFQNPSALDGNMAPNVA